MALKNNQTPPCSCCGNKQKQYESWYKIIPERVFYDDATYPLNLITSLDIYFICPSCYDEVFKKLIPYKEKVETYWIPQQ